MMGWFCDMQVVDALENDCLPFLKSKKQFSLEFAELRRGILHSWLLDPQRAITLERANTNRLCNLDLGT